MKFTLTLCLLLAFTYGHSQINNDSVARVVFGAANGHA
jgi:hypothetical protein